MKKLYILTAALYSIVSAHAQAVFTAGDFLNVGASDTFRIGVPSNPFTLGLGLSAATSEAYTWDYSAIAFSPAAVDYSCGTPNPADYLAFPPGANLKENSNILTMDNLYQKLADTAYLMRSGGSTTSGTLLLPKIRYITFPLNYGDSMGVKQVEYADAGLTTEAFTRKHSYKYDGYGTVKLPWGNYSNVFRIKMTTRDSSHVFSNYFNTYSAYYYFTKDGGVPPVRFLSSSMGDSVSHNYNMIANRSATPTAVNIIAGAAMPVSFYPNPVQDKLYIAGAGNRILHVSVKDMLGREIIGKKINGTGAVDVTVLPSGLYLVTLCDTNDGIAFAQLIRKN